MNIRVVATDWNTDRSTLETLRRRIFIEEQGVPEELEWDAEDATATHFLVYSSSSEAIATARLVRESAARARIGRFAVSHDHRRKGVGRILLDAMIAMVCEAGYAEIVLSAQLTAVPFYVNAGFKAHGDTYLDAGIEHRSMRMTLDGGKRT